MNPNVQPRMSLVPKSSLFPTTLLPRMAKAMRNWRSKVMPSMANHIDLENCGERAQKTYRHLLEVREAYNPC